MRTERHARGLAESHSSTSVIVEAAAGRVRVRTAHRAAAGRPVLRPVLMSSDEGGATVSLVPDGALLLDGDRLRVSVRVGDDLELRLVEAAGTVAYPMDGGSASVELDLALGSRARLSWEALPFVACTGSHTSRRTAVIMAPGACLRMHEMVVLGRCGEAGGSVSQHLEIREAGGRPILVEDLKLGPDMPRHLLGGASVVGSLVVLGEASGIETAPPGWTRLELESGELHRYLGQEAHRAGIG